MKKVTVQFVDDLDGDVIPEGEGRTVPFAFDGRSYEIDLSNANIDKLQSALAPFIEKARPAGGRSGGRGQSTRVAVRSRGGDPGELQAIREWAQANGFKVGDRGRIASEVREAYAAAHA